MRGTRACAAAAVCALAVAGPAAVLGTSYNPLTPEAGASGTMRAGAAVFLFHSGTDETRRSIREGDVLTVRRPGTGGRGETVGAVRVGAALGGRCFRGRVLEGKLQPLDVAESGACSFLVLASDAPCVRETGR